MLRPAPIQTTYTRYLKPGFPGMLADEVNFAADTRTVETAAGIGFGLAVSQGTNQAGCILGGSAFVGITRADPTLVHAEGGTVDKYVQYDSAAVLVIGDIWVYAPGADVGEAVNYNTTTGALTSGAGTALTNARWMTSADADGLAVVRLWRA